MCRMPIISLVLCLPLVIAEVGEAQLVRVGPFGGVRVRAPFVRVEVGPLGRTYVRAPFTSVYAPGFRGDVRYHEYAFGPFLGYELPPTGEEVVAHMNWRELRFHTRAAAGAFEDELAHIDSGGSWRATLRPGTIRDLLAEESDQPPDQATAEELLAILESYDAVANSDTPPWITQLDEFLAVRHALGELTLPPLQRQRRNLALQWLALHRDLGRFTSGASWQGYLELPPEVTAGYGYTDAPDIARDVSEPDLKQLEEILRRYDEVDRTRNYRAIARLANFQATRQLLGEFVDLQKRTASDLGRLPAKLEEPPVAGAVP